MSQITVQDSGFIVNDDATIGRIRFANINENDVQIFKMKIYPDYQGNGYATDALDDFISLARHRGYDAIETNHVTHVRMDYALESAGFHYVEDHKDNVYRFEL